MGKLMNANETKGVAIAAVQKGPKPDPFWKEVCEAKTREEKRDIIWSKWEEKS